jgi:pimeloyl-ACP methyl ester carboxylesterase
MTEVASRHGQKLFEIPPKVAAPAAEVLFRLRLSPASADWVGSGEVHVDNSKLKEETGWQPRFNGREASMIHLFQRGRPLMMPTPELHRPEVAEAALETATRAVRQWADVDPGELSHEWLPFRTGELHVEVHEADAADATIVFSPGIGGHARFYTPVLAALRRAGFNVVGVDRPGHGLSTGRRGDCPMPVALDALDEVIRWSRARFGLPVVLAGSSLGGITTWYALTREPDIACAVCHNINHPTLRIDRKAELTVPVVQRLAKLMPHAPVRIKDFADFDAVAADARILAYFESEEDRLWNWTLTMRTGASFFNFEPQLPWERVTTPTLVVVGEADEMVSPDFTRAAFERATPPRAELRVLPGMGHMLFHEQLDEMVDLVGGFVREHVSEAQEAPTS